jgi:hypothetical protein
LLLGQVAVTLSFSLVAIRFFKRSEFNAFFNIRNAGWFAIIGFSSFVGWTASLEGLKSGSVATLTMIKAVNPFLAAVFCHIFLPLPQPNHTSRRLTWMVLAGAACSFYAHDRASADVRACFCFFIAMLSASINTVYLKHMQLSSLLPEDALLSVLYCSALINAAAMPFVLAAFFNTVSSDVAVQVCCFCEHAHLRPSIFHSDRDVTVCADLLDRFSAELVFFNCDFAVGFLGPEAPQPYRIHCSHQLLQNTRRHHQHAVGSGWLLDL